jgi:YD repeat-containing protein
MKTKHYIKLILALLLVARSAIAVQVLYLYDSLNRLTNVDYGNGSVISYTYDPAGNRMTYSGAVANDTIPPSISITNPTSGWSFTNTSATINLSGTASDNAGVTLVTWQNYSGGIGVASGTTSWSINGIPLKAGVNYIFVTAYDAAGNSTDAMLAVTYVVPPVIQITDLTLGSNATAQMTVVGPAGGVLAVQTSTDLVQWYTIGIVTNATGSFQFPFPFSSTESKQFFRAVQAQAPTNMVLIPAGSFTMGDSVDGDTYGYLPLHTVYVSGFYMDKHDVTLALWQQVYNWAITHGYSFDYAGSGNAANHPVQMIDWYGAVKWCNARSEMEGRTPAYYTDAGLSVRYRTGQVAPYVNWNAGYRLPTEAEWEKAARGGLSGHRFPWGDIISESLANYYGDTSIAYDLGPNGLNTHFAGAYPGTSPVGYFAPNGYGLYDMAGNVFQWCWDVSGPPSSSSQTDPRGPTYGSARVVRCGYWNGAAWSCRTADRTYADYPAFGNENVGFRSVLPQGQ